MYWSKVKSLTPNLSELQEVKNMLNVEFQELRTSNVHEEHKAPEPDGPVPFQLTQVTTALKSATNY